MIGEENRKYNLAQRVMQGLTRITASGITGRGPSPLCEDIFWQQAVNLIAAKKKIAIISGFYVPAVSAPETDGPPGSIVLARALGWIGHEAEIWTDSFNIDCFKKCSLVMGIPDHTVKDISDRSEQTSMPDLLIYIERSGRAADGKYYNMRGEDISAWTPPLDSFALSPRVIPVIAVGDGGNEVGMGSLKEPLSHMMEGYAPYLCVVESDVCIPVDVSNWGAYALTAALSSVSGRWLGQTSQEEQLMLYTLSQSGAVDGCTKKRELSVDGLAVEEHVKIRSALEDLVH